MKGMNYTLFILTALMNLFPAILLSQQVIDELHGNELYSYRGWHSGNMIRTCFYNDGDIGWRTTQPDGFGEWPINSGQTYINLITYFFGAEVKDRYGLIQHIVSEGNGVVAGDASHPASGDPSIWHRNWPTFRARIVRHQRCPRPAPSVLRSLQVQMSRPRVPRRSQHIGRVC